MPEPLLRIDRLTKRYGSATVVDDAVARDPARRVPRRDRAQRRRQDDDAAHVPRPHRSRRRDDRGLRAADPGERARGEEADRRRHPVRQPRSRLQLCREPARLRPLFRPVARGARGADAEAARVLGAPVQGRREAGRALGRHEAAALARPCADQRSRPAAARRADDRPRPAGPAPDVGAPAEPARRGQGDPADDPLHGRGRAPVRSPDRARPRPQDHRGHAARPDRRAPRERRRRGLRRRRRGGRPRPRGAGRSRRDQRRHGVLLPARAQGACSTRSPPTTTCATCTAPRTSRTCSSS